MKFRYIGDYPEGVTSLQAYGETFSPGAAVEVAKVYEGKALGNKFFELVEDDNEPECQPEIAEEPVNALLAEPEAPAEPEGDDDPYDDMGKDELIAIAEQRGIKVDGRWKRDRILEAVRGQD